MVKTAQGPTRAPRFSQIPGPAVLWIVAIATLLGHAALFGSWIVDDAGIVFAYARNLAEGQGLVAQPGALPVEGYSNFTWVLLLCAAFLVELFHPVWTPKLLALLLALGAFWLVWLNLRRHDDRGTWVAPCIALLLSLNTSFVVWTFSGLEGPLFVCLLAALLLLCCQVGFGTRPSWPSSLLAGALTGLVAMTRPDGIVYVAAFPLSYLIARSRDRIAPGREDLLSLACFGLGLGTVFGGFLGFRVLYFGQWVPNTYLAKGGPGLDSLRDVLLLSPPMVNKGIGLFSSVAGYGAGLLFAAVASATCYLAGRRAFSRSHGIWLLFLLLSMLAYLLLPYDWMGEYRFATPFFLFFYGYCALVSIRLLEIHTTDPTSLRRALGWTMLGAASLCIVVFSGRSATFAERPTVPFARISEQYAFRFDDYAERLGVTKGSMLLPDVGGPLYYSKLQVFDLAGLIDPQIARTLDRDHPALHDYIFEEAKPTFIHTHASWALKARLDTDPRFRRDYVPLREAPDAYAWENYRVRMYSGDYVLRAVAEAHPEVIVEIRSELEYEPAEHHAGRL